jgi:uncharacterized protein YeeX (DUF496 family)
VSQRSQEMAKSADKRERAFNDGITPAWAGRLVPVESIVKAGMDSEVNQALGEMKRALRSAIDQHHDALAVLTEARRDIPKELKDSRQ